MTGLCALPKEWEVIHGQKLLNSAGVSQHLNMNQLLAPMKEKTASVMVMWLMELDKAQMTLIKSPLLKK